MKSTAARLTIVLTVLTAFFVFAGASAAADATAKVDINTASKTQLETLNGVGDALADRIIEYRENNGLFKTPQDIQNVKGIGPSTFKKNQDRIVVGTPEPAEETPKTPSKEAPKSQDKPKS